MQKALLLLLGRVILVAQRPIVIKLSRERSVGRSVQCNVEKRRIGSGCRLAGRTGPGMRQVAGFADMSTGRGTFGGEFGARHCNQWKLYGARVRQRRDAALFPNCFGQTCYYGNIGAAWFSFWFIFLVLVLVLVLPTTKEYKTCWRRHVDDLPKYRPPLVTDSKPYGRSTRKCRIVC